MLRALNGLLPANTHLFFCEVSRHIFELLFADVAVFVWVEEMEGQLGFVFLPIVTPILQRTPSAPRSARRTASVGYKLLFANQSENKATPLSVSVDCVTSLSEPLLTQIHYQFIWFNTIGANRRYRVRQSVVFSSVCKYNFNQQSTLHELHAYW